MTSTAPKLQFGEHGELTERTIRQAKLTKEERKRAFQMLEVQKAYLEILDSLSYPVDPEGHVHDLNALPMPTKIAIAWTMALSGARFSGEKFIKKRAIPGSMYADSHTWVDSREPDVAVLKPEHSSMDVNLPPDTARLAALRDGVQPRTQPEWHVTPKIVETVGPRPEET